MYEEDLLKRKNHKDIVYDIERRYKDGDGLNPEEVARSDDDIEKPGLRDPKVLNYLEISSGVFHVIRVKSKKL